MTRDYWLEGTLSRVGWRNGVDSAVYYTLKKTKEHPRPETGDGKPELNCHFRMALARTWAEVGPDIHATWPLYVCWSGALEETLR
ncbi:hypothetical protein RRG08_045454 [Elysia crispata]|uniref:Uncharacterized protein n=1 Tax=Elysia crispata TaxID=231223 RepID=A0AAE1E5T5_9GAST|nr:hypothetical protein RRG08_045454 [Elysia crispata]